MLVMIIVWKVFVKNFYLFIVVIYMFILRFLVFVESYAVYFSFLLDSLFIFFFF